MVKLGKENLQVSELLEQSSVNNNHCLQTIVLDISNPVQDLFKTTKITVYKEIYYTAEC